MKFSISNKAPMSCVINLHPENAEEKEILASGGHHDTYQFYYQKALYDLIDPNAELLTVTNDHMYPKTVFAKFQIVKGIGM
jgi:hypothetical protein